jgi:hypothetical protein
VPASKAKTAEVDDLDAGWEDEEDDLDSGWGDPDEEKEPEPPEEIDDRASIVLTPGERAARAARAAEKKERLRLKAGAKAQRRRARAATAKSKQKKTAPRSAGAPPSRAIAKRSERRVEEESVEAVAEPRVVDASALQVPHRDWRRMALLVVLIVVAGGVALYVFGR